MINTRIKRDTVFIETLDGNTAYRVSSQDLYDTANVNFQLSSNYEISMTLTYTEKFKDVFNTAQAKRGIWYYGQWYDIQQLEPGLDENGVAIVKLTATATIIDRLKNMRIDPVQPTEDNPQSSDSNSASDDSNSNDNQQAGVVIKKASEETNLHPLSYYLDSFFKGNRQSTKYELHGDFPQLNVELTGSCYDWITSNLASFKAYWVPDNYVLKIYDLAHLKVNNGRQLRYLNNLTNVDIQTDATNIINCCDVYAGKMQKTTTTVSGGSVSGSAEMKNGDYVSVLKYAADLVGEHLSDADINLVKAQVMLESGGNETIVGGDDGLSDGHAIGILQFKQGTFDYYSRQPYTNIKTAIGQFVALLNIPNWRNQINGRTGWSPHGAPITKDPIQVKPAVDNSWGWPFPSVGEGTFMQAQKFGYDGGYRTNSFHDGLDFGSIDHPGSEVHAVHGGKVTISRAWGSGGIGWYIVIQDSSGLNVEYQEAFASAGNIIKNVGDIVKTGDVIGYRNTDHLHIGITRHSFPEAFSHAFSNDGTWLDPQAMIKNGGDGQSGGSSSDSTTTTTTTEEYYSIHFTYRNQESIKNYKEHWGPPITLDSIYDQTQAQQYVDSTVQHDPAVTFSITGNYDGNYQIGEVFRAVVPRMKLNTDVTLVGIDGSDQRVHPGADMTLTFDNTGLAMKDVNVAIMEGLKNIKTSSKVSGINMVTATNEHKETHTATITAKYTEDQMRAWKDYTDGKEVTWPNG
ncbi:phage tail protein [Lactobacillus sp. 3B(2020)]|uniref:phage tail protein n=1 Tax=Lactobacillus sp. 3B(2020) TaxID=2695882 RepID=UPI0015DE0864|nr:phage tail protein [Lactobacillus sp. 3B(2020)]QLL69603.1 peptidoglycan DD-metalloendopeptidase family protein [Lactobacillus sp. 3B(2020)]